MGVVWRVLPVGIAEAWPLTRWPQAAQEQATPEAWLTAAAIWVLGPYLRAIGAVYDADKPTVPSPRRRFPELSPDELQALWAGDIPAGVPAARAREFYEEEIAVARARPSEPGVPAFKLFENGPPWHVTVDECAEVTRITLAQPRAELDPDPERRGWQQWQDLAALFERGATADGVITS